MASPQTTTVSVGTTDSTHTDFSPVVNRVMIKNTGSYNCYINLNATATTSMYKLYTGQTITIGLSTITDVHAICDTGESTTLVITGIVQW